MRGTKRMTYLEDPNKEKCDDPGKGHMNHSERDRKWKIEVVWRKNPLQRKMNVTT